MEPRILGFPAVMGLVDFLESKEMSWIFFDDSLPPNEMFLLILSLLSDNDVAEFLYLCFGDEELDAETLVETASGLFSHSKIQEAIVMYRKIMVK